MMSHRSNRLVACLGVILGMVLIESDSAQAQRLLQRIRERVGSRLDENQPAEQNGTQTEGEVTESSTPVIDALTDPDSLAMQALRSLLEEPNDQESNRRPELPARPGDTNSSAGNPFGNLQPLQPDRYEGRGAGASASLGINVLPTEPTETSVPGLVVTSIDSHSLADEAGLRAGDTIVALNGTPAYSTAVVAEQLRKFRVGERVRVRFLRDQKVREIQIPLVNSIASTPATAVESLALPPPSLKPAPSGQQIVNPFGSPTTGSAWTAERVGLVLADAGNRRGLVVSDVQSDSISQSAGIRAGDRIVAVDGRMVSSRDMLTEGLSQMDADNAVSLKLVRGQSLVVAELSPTLKPSKEQATEAPSSALGGFGSMLNGFFGGASGEGDAKPSDVEQANENAVTPSDGKTVEQTGFSNESNRLPLPSLANDPPSLLPLVEPDRKQQLEDLKRRKQEIQLELQRLQRQIKELESDAKED
ncbi:MAG: PDZ domain-containing protein [Planctomycetota bacterium]